MDILIRAAKASDYPALLSFIQNELGYTQLDPERLYERLQTMNQSPDYATFVADMAGTAVGFIGLHRVILYNYDDDCFEITALAVSASWQGKGIGSRLLRLAETYAREQNASILILTSNLRRLKAHAFYEHNGYQKKSFGFYRHL